MRNKRRETMGAVWGDVERMLYASLFAFIANESIPIIENAGLMGIPIPSAITRVIEVLTKKLVEEEELNE